MSNMNQITDQQAAEIAKPFVLEIINGSNRVDYDLFSRSFSAELKKELTRESFERKCAQIELLTSLSTEVEFMCCLRRGDEYLTVWKQKTVHSQDEYLNLVTIKPIGDKMRVVKASLY